MVEVFSGVCTHVKVMHSPNCCWRCSKCTTSFLPPPQQLQDGVQLPVFPPTILAAVQILLIRSSPVPAVVDTVVVIGKAVVFFTVLLLAVAVVVLLPRHVVITSWSIQIIIVLLQYKATLGIVVATAVVVAMAVMMAMAMAMPLVKTVPPITLYFVRIEFFRWSPT